MTEATTDGVTHAGPTRHAVAAPAAALSAVPCIPYADAVTRAGMSCLVTPAGLRLLASPVPSWRHLSKGYWVTVPLAAFAGLIAVQALGLMGGPTDPGLWPGAIEFGGAALVLAARAAWLLRHRLIVDVARDELAVSVVNLAGAGDRAAWPRRDVREIKLNPHNGKLLLRIAGRDLLEYAISHDPAAAHWAAETLREAVVNGTFAAPRGADAPVRPPASRRRLFSAASALGFLVALAGVIFLICGNGIGVLLIVLALVELAVASGLRYGTQDKKFFT